MNKPTPRHCEHVGNKNVCSLLSEAISSQNSKDCFAQGARNDETLSPTNKPHSHLTALSPLDGRYAEKLSDLSNIFSEYSLFYHRVMIEIAWVKKLISTLDIPSLSNQAEKILQNIINNFALSDAEQIKLIEQKTRHDMKAIEYFLKEKFAAHPELANIQEFIHFGLTSEDINNLAYSLMLKKAINNIITPWLFEMLKQIKQRAHQWAEMAILSRTHGQAATPTTLGKEWANTAYRLARQLDQLKSIPIMGKLNGAVGNYNALCISYPKINWEKISEEFVNELALTWNPYTTQIEPKDALAELCHCSIRINNILMDFSRNAWLYISLDYFKQASKDSEIGSSTMPHKINPIDFENAEGNLGLSNVLLAHFANKLTQSRWQRDLSDSTVLRKFGESLAHALLGYQSILAGQHKLIPNLSAISKDLDQHFEILAEAIQTIMRKFGKETPYEQLKKLTRGHAVDAKILREFISGLELPDEIKSDLLKLSPKDYIGMAAELAKKHA